jgi:hypothetical protein
MWRERNFHRDLWRPAQEASGLVDIRPYESAATAMSLTSDGINDADLAEIAGHRVETCWPRYKHPTSTSFGPVWPVIH